MQQDPSRISPIKILHDLARQNKILAEYRLEKESGPAHAKLYTIRLCFGEKEYTGIDRSIKLAQRSAAQNALTDYTHHLSTNNPQQETKTSQSPTVALNTWAAQHHIPTRYIVLDEKFLSACNPTHIIFSYRLLFGHDLYFDGHGSSHQQARTNCAQQALDFIHQNQMPIVLTTPTLPIQSKSPISLMYERAKQLGLSVQTEQVDPVTITYHIGEDYSITVTAATKQAAKQMAAEKMLEILPLTNEKQKQKNARKRSNQHRRFIEQKGSNNYSSSEEINPITRLYQIARARNMKIEFSEIENPSNHRLFQYHVKLNENDYADGFGKSKQAAKRSAAENLLLKLFPNLTLPPPPIKGLLKREEKPIKSQEKKHVHFLEDEIIHPDPKILSIQDQLINACQRLSIRIQYDNKMIKDNDQYESILSLSKDDKLLAKFRGNAGTLTHAEENVSATAWKNLQDLFSETID